MVGLSHSLLLGTTANLRFSLSRQIVFSLSRNAHEAMTTHDGDHHQLLLNSRPDPKATTLHCCSWTAVAEQVQKPIDRRRQYHQLWFVVNATAAAVGDHNDCLETLLNK